ncbi:MAG TPA: patatin-like protein [Blastocatellia bacterium]|nr:patatin-like protein [Blastocatellia bacterium]
MKNQNNTQVKSREVRLGLVMYGGVSLAIYINGVAREFFRAVRGNGVYKWIKALTDSDIVVDVISGSSAGGINGIMLAYALCNNKDFADAAELWRRDGDIRSLLRMPDAVTSGTRSLLDSQGYYQPRLEEAFRFMSDYVPRDSDEFDKFNTPVRELDLFVTGTDVDGNIVTIFDDAGHPVDVKDHRSVFLLKHRPGRKEPFNPKFANPKSGSDPDPAVTYEALAKLARITSCFPAAFEPVTVSYREQGKDKSMTAGGSEKPETADDKLQDWGRLRKETTFLDGGVIDNKPFTHTLREIFARAATRQIERILFYVEPDPEFFQQRSHASQPNFLQTILSSLVGIPGYESISDDLKLLSNRNRKLIQYRRLVNVAKEDAQSFDLHNRSRLIILSDRVVLGVLREDGRDVHLADPEQRRIGAALVDQFDRLHCPDDKVGTDKERETLNQVRSTLYKFDVYFRLRRLRHLVYKIYALLYPNPADSKKLNIMPFTQQSLRNLWEVLNWQVEVLEIITARLEKMLDDTDFQWQEKSKAAAGKGKTEEDVATEVAKQIWAEVQKQMLSILTMPAPRKALLELHTAILKFRDDAIVNAKDPKSENSERQKPEGIKTAFTKFHNAFKPVQDQTREEPKSLLRITDDQEKELLRKFVDDVKDDPCHDQLNLYREYINFRTFDARQLPLELMGDLSEKDLIETIRISPADADKGFSNKGLQDKVAGDALYHFASFFKRSWRSNDILWGRLDGLCQIVETLLKEKALVSPKRFRQFFFKDGDLQNGWEPEMEPERLFPNAGQQTHEKLRNWIEDLGAGNNDARDKSRVAEIVKLLIEAEQLEVLHVEVPNVISDALAEQALWNQFRARSDKSAKPGAPRTQQPGDKSFDRFSFHPPDGSLDQFVGTVAAAAQSYANTKDLRGGDEDAPRPTFTKLGKFFRHEYKIGSEQLLRDMPLPVLLEILAVTLLVMRNCILDVFGAKAAKVKQSLVYYFGVDLPLRAFYGAVLFMRRAPRDRLTYTLYAIGGLSVLALAAGIVWWDPIVWPAGGQFHRLRFLCFILAPAILFGGLILFWARYRFPRQLRTRGQRLAPVLRAAFQVAWRVMAVTAFLFLLVGVLRWEHFTALQAQIILSLHFPEWMAGSVGWMAWSVLLLALVGFGLTSYFVVRLATNVYQWLVRPGTFKVNQLRAVLSDYFSMYQLRLLALRLGVRAASQLDKKEREEAIKTHEQKIAEWDWIELEKLKTNLARACPPLSQSQADFVICQLPTRTEDKKEMVSGNHVLGKLRSFGVELRRQAVKSLNGKNIDVGERMTWDELKTTLEELLYSDGSEKKLLEPWQVELLLSQVRAEQRNGVTCAEVNKAFPGRNLLAGANLAEQLAKRLLAEARRGNKLEELGDVICNSDSSLNKECPRCEPEKMADWLWTKHIQNYSDEKVKMLMMKILGRSKAEVDECARFTRIGWNKLVNEKADAANIVATLKSEQKKGECLGAVWQVLDGFGEELFSATDWQLLEDRLGLKQNFLEKMFVWFEGESKQKTLNVEELANEIRGIEAEALR